VTVRPLTAADLPAADQLLRDTLGSRMQARRGELVDVIEPGDGLLALDAAGVPVGIVTWSIEAAGDAAEVRAITVAGSFRGRGIGRALLDASALALRAAGVSRAWLVTTNDNLGALALYQKAGWRLAALRRGAIDDARRRLKPGIPEIGQHGIPLRDELELELDLAPGASKVP
jgi:ribosomal protein S18 acetylase RimI-like enzyme